LKPLRFSTNLPNLEIGGLVVDWNFPNLPLTSWLKILASTHSTQPVHTPNQRWDMLGSG